MTHTMMTPNLTNLLYFIDSFAKEHKYAPSIREIQFILNYSSTSVTLFYLSKLKKLGLVNWIIRQNRTIHSTHAGEAYLMAHQVNFDKAKIPSYPAQWTWTAKS